MNKVTILPDLIFIAAPTMRSRAYAQNLINYNILPSQIILLPGREPDTSGLIEQTLTFPGFKKELIFNPAERLLETLQGYDVDFFEAPSADLNSREFINFFNSITGKYAIFSGKGGNILFDEILAAGKRFLHAHGGYVPEYKGSTSFYYSMLREGSIGASAIWLKREIDTGDILFRYQCPAPIAMNYDQIVDPALRSFVITEVIADYAKNGFWRTAQEQNSQDGNTYFVIHPLLKNRAITRANS